MTQDQIWSHFDRMQRVAMAAGSIITREEFFAEPERDQREYYAWMSTQVGPITVGPAWW